MLGSKEFLKKRGVHQKISFKDGKPHTFELVKDKIETLPTPDGEKEGVKYLVKEGGELRTFFTSSESLISRLSDYKEGDTVTVELTSKSIGGQFKSVYTVKGAGATGAVEVEDDIWPESE